LFLRLLDHTCSKSPWLNVELELSVKIHRRCCDAFERRVGVLKPISISRIIGGMAALIAALVVQFTGIYPLWLFPIGFGIITVYLIWHWSR
jgi:hypothetical protein